MPVRALLISFAFLALNAISSAQGTPAPENATAAALHAFETHDIVMFGEIHGNKQEYEWLRSLVATPEFADPVDDIVMEFGNSLYQRSVDRYVAGENVPFEQVQKAWRNMVGAAGPPDRRPQSTDHFIRPCEKPTSGGEASTRCAFSAAILTLTGRRSRTGTTLLHT